MLSVGRRRRTDLWTRQVLARVRSIWYGQAALQSWILSGRGVRPDSQSDARWEAETEVRKVSDLELRH